jgi:hypothetical protein
MYLPIYLLVSAVVVDMGVSFIVLLTIATSSYRNPASTGTSDDSCHALGHDERDILYIFICYAVREIHT